MGKVLIEKPLYLKYVQKTSPDLKQLHYKLKALHSILFLFFLNYHCLKIKKKVSKHYLSLVYHLQKGSIFRSLKTADGKLHFECKVTGSM